MTITNASGETAHVNIMIHKGGHSIVSYNVKPLFEGPRDFCMGKIRKLVEDYATQGGRKIVFHIQVMMAGDMYGMYDKSYYTSHLSRLNASCNCDVEVQSNLYKVY